MKFTQKLDRTVQIDPLLKALGSLNTPNSPQDLARVLGEFVDNSLDAGATRVSIDLYGNQLVITDDGKGMNALELTNMPNIAQSIKSNQIGRYGMGFKLSSAEIAESYKVSTISKEDNLSKLNIFGKCTEGSYFMSTEKLDAKGISGTSLILELKKDVIAMLKKHDNKLFYLLSLMYLPNSKIKIFYLGRELENCNLSAISNKTTLVEIFSKSSQGITFKGYLIPKNTHWYSNKDYRGTYVYLKTHSGLRGLVLGSSMLLDDLTNTYVDYSTLRVVIQVDDSSIFVPSTNKDKLLVTNGTASSQLEDWGKELCSVYLKHLRCLEEALNEKRINKVLEKLSKQLTEFCRSENIDWQQYGLTGSIYQKNENPTPVVKTENPESRAERSDKNKKRDIKINAVTDKRGENSRHLDIEVSTPGNIIKVVLNLDHPTTKKVVEPKKLISEWAPEILTRITFLGTDPSVEEYLNRHSHFMGLLTKANL